MKTIAVILLGLLLGYISLQVWPHEVVRSAAAVREFRRNNICPSTQTYSKSCPGYVVDHIIPLCAGGEDTPSNMQYQTRSAALEKDKLEWWVCRRLKTCSRN